MAPKFPLPIETCKAKPLDGENCYEVEDYFAKGFAFQVKSNNDVSSVAKKVFAITKLLCDLNVAHNVFISRGKNFCCFVFQKTVIHYNDDVKINSNSI